MANKGGRPVGSDKSSLNSYIIEKLRVLRELQITLTYDQLKHMKSLKSEIQVDNYAHDLIMKR